MIKYEKLSNGGVVAQTPTGMVEISPNDDGAYEVYRDGRFLGVAKTLVAAKKILSSAPRKNPLPKRAKLAKALALRAGFRSTAGTHKDKKPRVKTVTVRGVDGGAPASGFDVGRRPRTYERRDVGNRVVHPKPVASRLKTERLVEIHRPLGVDGEQVDGL